MQYEDMYRYGGAGVGLVTALLLNRLLGNTSVKSNVIGAALGLAAGYGGGHYLYHKRLNENKAINAYTSGAVDNPGKYPYMDPKTGEMSFADPYEVLAEAVNIANETEGDDKAKAEAAVNWFKSNYGDAGWFTAEQIEQKIADMRMVEQYNQLQAKYDENPFAFYTNAPIRNLAEDLDKHNKKLDKLDEVVLRMQKDNVWKADGYQNTGLSEADFSKAQRAAGVKSKQFAAMITYSRLLKDVHTNSIIRQHYNNDEPLSPTEIDYIAYNSMPKMYRDAIPLGYRRVAAERARLTNGWSYEIDDNWLRDPDYKGRSMNIVNWTNRAAATSYIASTLALGGHPGLLAPYAVYGWLEASAGNLPRYTALHQQDTWANNRSRNAAMEILSDPSKAPQYYKPRYGSLDNTSRLFAGADVLDMGMDTLSLFGGKTSPTSWLVQSAINAGSLKQSTDEIKNRKTKYTSKDMLADNIGYNYIWSSHLTRPSNTYDAVW